MSKLVIVESPAKAKTITKFLGKGFVVRSSFGHVRDLPKSKMGIDIEHNFEPHYIISKDKAKVAKELKEAAKKSNEILFATDEDREGEAISWHLAQMLDIEPEEAKRITFHEITKTAIVHAVENPRALNLKLVDAQQARRVLDRLVGYELSPFLWRKVAKGLSAGRVQSVAVRLVVEREREIQSFKSEEYWTIEAIFESLNSKITTVTTGSRLGGINQKSDDETQTFTAKLHAIGEKKLGKMDLKNRKQVDGIVKDLDGAGYKVNKIEHKESKRTPPPPFTTSRLQQEANNRLGFSAKQTMRLAQQLYEGVELGSEGSVGLITYMRTDSVNLSDKFLSEAHALIGNDFGARYQLASPRRYQIKSKGAQEAHEAIRPTEVSYTPDSVKVFLDKNQYKLYDLIWRRAVASQMAQAELSSLTVDIIASSPCEGGKARGGYTFRATGQTIIFDGFIKLYPDSAKEIILPPLKENEDLNCRELKPEQHFTEPPARYSDAALIKALEEHGIGRPSTYAPTIATIEDRKYVERDEKKKLKPTDIAFLVNDLLVEHFPRVVDYQFTAQMEEDLDKIARGEKEWRPLIADFYHPFKQNLDQKDRELNKKDITEEKTDETCDKCGSPMIIKLGRYGKFLACGNYPECKNTKPLKGQENEAAAPAPTDIVCDKCGNMMVRRQGRYGPFLGCSNYPKCKNIINIEIKTNLKCPKCEKGDVVERRSKRGKIFYGCNRYPECDFVLWNKPTGELCPDCKQPLVYGPKGTVKCSNKECVFQKTSA